MRPVGRNACVATVTDPVYLPGTVVLLSSFLEHNPRFEGDIVIIHDDLPQQQRRRLERFPNVRFHAVGRELKARVAAVTAAHPTLAAKAAILFSLESFNLPAYSHVLKLDSDLVCVDDATPLFFDDRPLLCCPDQAYFWGQFRDTTTYMPRRAATGAAVQDVFPATFNCGLILFSPARLSPDVYSDLLEMVHPDLWSTIQTSHTDSVVLNRYFRACWTPLAEKYNYLISPGMLQYTRKRVPIRDAVFLHFLGRPKPWQEARDATPLNDDHRDALEAWEAASAIARADFETTSPDTD